MGKYSEAKLLRLPSIGVVDAGRSTFTVHPTRNPGVFFLRDGSDGNGEVAAEFRTDVTEYPYWHGHWSTVSAGKWKASVIDRAKKLIFERRAQA